MCQHLRMLSPCLARMKELMGQLLGRLIPAPCHLDGELAAAAHALLIALVMACCSQSPAAST